MVPSQHQCLDMIHNCDGEFIIHWPQSLNGGRGRAQEGEKADNALAVRVKRTKPDRICCKNYAKRTGITATLITHHTHDSIVDKY